MERTELKKGVSYKLTNDEYVHEYGARLGDICELAYDDNSDIPLFKKEGWVNCENHNTLYIPLEDLEVFEGLEQES